MDQASDNSAAPRPNTRPTAPPQVAASPPITAEPVVQADGAADSDADYVASPRLWTGPLEPTPLPTHPNPLGVAALGHHLSIRIGNYLITREIAVGGMGTVYEAVQDQPRRVVALKLLRGTRSSSGAGAGAGGASPLGGPSRAQQRRFEFESELLARLRHPGIAQVFEAGTHQHGDQDILYYAMELVPGARPITTYAREEKLTTAARIELFAGVCDAVHHAHTKGIIHRDLKPGNILIDLQGRSKVIDFGVARAADSDQVSPTLQTDASQLIGTLQYMSPEQCEIDPRELDARSDVYSLGVILYELLCGRLPYDVKRMNVSDATRTIREHSPAQPSTIDPALRGDLETVLLKALHKDRARRYQTAEEFRRDLQQVLAGEPISARRDSAIYLAGVRTRTFTRRHRVLVTTAALILAFIAVEKLGFRYLPTKVARVFEQSYLAHFAPVPAASIFNSVRVVAIKDGTDVEALAADRAPGVRAKDLRSLRRLHGWLLERLARTNVGVVAWDIGFDQPSSHDEALVKGAEAMRRHGRELVFASGMPTNQPQIIPALAGVAKYGPTTGDYPPAATWHFHLAVLKANGMVIPSFPLQAVTATWHSHAEARVKLDRLGDAAEIRYVDGDTTSVDLLPLDVVDNVQSSNHMGLEPNDWVGYYTALIPPQNVLDAATLDYADVIRADDAQLARWFDGKVVVVGDFRDPKDRRTYADGRVMQMPYMHAAVIDSLLRNDVIRMPPMVNVFGPYIFSGYLFDAAAALGGVLIGWIFLRHRIAGRMMVVLALIGVLGVSIAAFHFGRMFFPPVLAMIALVVSCEIMFAAARLRKGQFG